MKNILVLGTGLSSVYLIDYLAKKQETYNWEITIADQDPIRLWEKTSSYPKLKTQSLDVQNTEILQKLIQEQDLVISLLPAFLQDYLGEICLKGKCHFLSASYTSDGLKKLAKEIAREDLLFLTETGLDPGIDHMSVMEQIHSCEEDGKEIIKFYSHTGALVAPESDNNPWHYKFTWNPLNVVKAGQGAAAQYLDEGKIKYVPYAQLFRRCRKVRIEGFSPFESYPNRDSIKYKSLYGLEKALTVYRGTLRIPPFCQNWDALIRLGFCNDQEKYPHLTGKSFADFYEALLPNAPEASLAQKLALALQIDPQDLLIQDLISLGLDDPRDMGLSEETPARILCKLLGDKWKLAPDDQDMIVMKHEFLALKEDIQEVIHSSLVIKGVSAEKTAIAKTVGLPLAIAAELLMKGEIKRRGLCIPIYPDIYKGILAKLEILGVKFDIQKKLFRKSIN